MLVTIETLTAAGIDPQTAAAFARPLSEACEKYEINTPNRLAAFIGQCRQESTGFTKLAEGMFYTDAGHLQHTFGVARVPSLQLAESLCRNPERLANTVYAGMGGNGTVESGDGWAYRGRGLIGITFHDEYAKLTDAIGDGNDFLSVPDLVAQPDWACLASAWWWKAHGCNELADAQDWDGITRVVNGHAMLAAENRREFTQQALAALQAPAENLAQANGAEAQADPTTTA